MKISDSVSTIHHYHNNIAKTAYLQAKYPNSPVEKIIPLNFKEHSDQTGIISEIRNYKDNLGMTYSKKGSIHNEKEAGTGRNFDYYA